MNPKQLLNIRANRAKLSLILQSLFPFGIHSLPSPSAQNTTFRPPPSIFHRDLSQISFEMLPYSRFSMIFGTIFFYPFTRPLESFFSLSPPFDNIKRFCSSLTFYLYVHPSYHLFIFLS